jgi:hypothetical protein
MVAIRYLCAGLIAITGGVAVARADAPRGELVVVSSPPKAGTSSTILFDAKIDLDLNFGGMAVITASTQSKKKKVEIVAVDPDGTVHKRITYTKRDTNIVIDGTRQKDDSPIRGKTYRVAWKKNVAADVKGADGKPVPEAEVEAVRKDEGQFQAPELLGAALSGLRLVEGQPFDVPLASLEKLLPPTFKPKRLVLTYRGKTADGARIDAEGSFVNEERQGLKMFLELKAELVLDPTGWCLDANVTGQVRAELNGKVVGSGGGTGTVKATPLR